MRLRAGLEIVAELLLLYKLAETKLADLLACRKTYMYVCVTNICDKFHIIKPTKSTNFSNLFSK